MSRIESRNQPESIQTSTTLTVSHSARVHTDQNHPFSLAFSRSPYRPRPPFQSRIQPESIQTKTTLSVSHSAGVHRDPAPPFQSRIQPESIQTKTTISLAFSQSPYRPIPSFQSRIQPESIQTKTTLSVSHSARVHTDQPSEKYKQDRHMFRQNFEDVTIGHVDLACIFRNDSVESGILFV